ncbi:MAG: hypothetical protein V3V16_09490 [Melioribacteraceae bacterium]
MKHFFITALLLTFTFIACDDTIVDPPEENGQLTLYVINESAETLSKINMEDTTIVKDIVTTGKASNSIRIYENKIYVVNSLEDNIKVIDPKDDTKVLQTIGLDVGDNPWDIAFASKTKAYVSNLKTKSVSVIDLTTGTVTKKINVGQNPEGILFKDGKVYVANTGYVDWNVPYEQSSVSVINTTTDKVVSTINTFINSQDLTFAPDGKLHVISTGDYATKFGKVAIVDVSSETLVDSVIIGGSPGDIEITKDGIAYCSAWGDATNGFLYSYNTSSKTVTNNNDNPIKVGPNLSGLTYDENENVLWIPYMKEWAGDGFVQRFDVTTNTITWTSDVVGNGTSAIAVYEYEK